MCTVHVYHLTYFRMYIHMHIRMYLALSLSLSLSLTLCLSLPPSLTPPRCPGVHRLLQYTQSHSHLPLQEAEQEQRTPLSLSPDPFPQDLGDSSWDPPADALLCHEHYHVWELSESVVYVATAPRAHTAQWGGIIVDKINSIALFPDIFNFLIAMKAFIRKAAIFLKFNIDRRGIRCDTIPTLSIWIVMLFSAQCVWTILQTTSSLNYIEMVVLNVIFFIFCIVLLLL